MTTKPTKRSQTSSSKPHAPSSSPSRTKLAFIKDAEKTFIPPYPSFKDRLKATNTWKGTPALPDSDYSASGAREASFSSSSRGHGFSSGYETSVAASGAPPEF
ncbi:hypothetical protein JCM8547_003165 [Rhodosporidiobolus lusitaniae]